MSPDTPPPVQRIAIRTDADLLTARQSARTAALSLGFSPTEITSIITALSELTRNILLYAGRGEIVVQPVQNHGRTGILLEARDEGPGIPDVDKAMLDGFSTSGGLGLGLPGTRRLMDEFDIASGPGRGTIVRTTKWIENHRR